MIPLEEIEADLANTHKDTVRLLLITVNLELFIRESGGENRSGFRRDLMKYQALLSESRALTLKIQAAKDKALGVFA